MAPDTNQSSSPTDAKPTGEAPEQQPAPASDAQPTGERVSVTPPGVEDAARSESAKEADRGLTDELASEIDDAMVALGLSDKSPKPKGRRQMTHAEREHQANAPREGAAPARMRGPRVVQGGREHRTGVVVTVGPTDIFVEFGPKELGIVEKSQFPEDQIPEKGAEVTLVVNKFDANESVYMCSLPGKVQKAEWELLEPGQIVEARVTGVNKGGLELEVAGHRAFMPASQISLNRIEDLSVFVGEKIDCEVQRIDRSGTGNIVLGRRNILAKEKAEKQEKLKGEIKEGDIREGVVRKIMPFGAFVDLGGMDGLVHISDMTHDRVTPSEKNVARFVEEGKTVRVEVLKIEWEKNRISLGMKQLQEDPFLTVANELTEGSVVTGRVVRTTDFGAFVEVGPGVEGLVHISELDWKRVQNVEQVVKADQVIQVKIIKIDPDTRKLSLSLKQTKEAPESRAPRGRGDRDNRSPEEILKETPAFRRMREKAIAQQRQTAGKEEEAAKKKAREKAFGSSGGLGDLGGFDLGGGLGNLKL